MSPRRTGALALTLALLLSGCAGPRPGSGSSETVSRGEETAISEEAAPKVPRYRSETDRDGDGVDDQTDILNNVKEYLRTAPKYRSIYYASGYPEDDHGVCTDVVGYGLRHAGYDLMELVREDIRANPGAYGISAPDAKIDFRRVPNLKVYFDHTAQSLTTGLDRPEAWQGGDIVVFQRPNHIGVVSDRRNPEGIPFVFHHIGKRQKVYEDYEEDMLPRWKDRIVGHYRIS